MAGKKKANRLDGKTWTRYSISIWSDIRKSKEEIALKHPAIFPEELVKKLIEIFTNEEQKVIFDPFAGIGSTVLAARNLGKIGIGIELNPEFARKANDRFTEQSFFDDGNGKVKIYIDDANNLEKYVDENTVDLVVTSPPYWDILSVKRTADRKDIRDYGDEKEDLGKISDYFKFLEKLNEIFIKVFKSMKYGAYCCVVVMDIRKKDRFFPYHSDIANFMKEIGFKYDDIIIWDRRHEYNNMRPLGFPYVFRVNKAHEFILIFQKPKSEGK